jgi:hypothetical protein
MKNKELLAGPQKYPDAKKHQIVSFIKSAVRIVGYGLLFVSIPLAAIVLIGSEAIGVLEELV